MIKYEMDGRSEKTDESRRRVDILTIITDTLFSRIISHNDNLLPGAINSQLKYKTPAIVT